MSWLDDLTWTCHVCHDERPDRLISVLSTKHLLGPAKVEVQVNVRYCNDRPECVAGAPDVNMLGGAR